MTGVHRSAPIDGLPPGRATFAAMLCSKSFFFAYFWFSHRPGGGEVSAFPTAGHLVAWAGLAPQQNETAGKRKNVRTKRQRWLKTSLVQAAHAAVKKRDSYLRTKYLRIRARRGSKKAIVAVAAAMLRAAYHILERSEEYTDLGSGYYDHINHKRSTKRLIRRLEGLGNEVNLKAAA